MLFGHITGFNTHITGFNTIISIKTTSADVISCLDILQVLTQSFQSKQRARTSFRIVISFRNVGSPHAFVCELFPITRIDEESLLAI